MAESGNSESAGDQAAQQLAERVGRARIGDQVVAPEATDVARE